MLTQVKGFYQRHEQYVPAAFFLLGFVFDIVTLDRIDAWLNIVQQIVYLLIVGVLIVLELLERQMLFQPSPRLSRIWKYTEAAVHFFLGSLLSVYTLFYFKSASFFSSFFFLVIIVALLVANEFQRFRGAGVSLRIAMLCLCAISYFIYVVPIILGWIGVVPFLIALALSSLVGMGVVRFVRRKGVSVDIIRKELILPFVSIHALFLLLYFLRILPPVPLSISYMGIYRGVEKREGKYYLTHTRPWWRFWNHGDQRYAYREGDALYGFASIFSPSRFKDTVQTRWLLYDKKHGWQSQDVIPFPIVGGRDQGYRGYTVKRSFGPGNWRLQVETSDGREIGRLYFTVFLDDSAEPRNLKTDEF
jgi:hypothetical protein